MGRTRLSETRGAAAVEFALVVPILIALIVAIAAFGRAYNIQSSMAMAAREGVRIAAIEHDISAGKTVAGDVADYFGFPEAVVTSDNSDPCDGPDQRANIQVKFEYDFFGLTGFFDSPIWITGKAEMRCGG